MKARHWTLVGALLLVATYVQATEGYGLSTPARSGGGISLPERLLLRLTTPTERFALTSTNYGESSIGSVSLVGDYFLSHIPAHDGRVSGFRATGGILISTALERPGKLPRATAGNGLLSLKLRGLALLPTSDAGSDTHNAPYLGIGYTSFSVKSGLSISADVGLAARKLGSAVQLGRVLNGTLSMEELLRALRLSPVLQLGVSYSF